MVGKSTPVNSSNGPSRSWDNVMEISSRIFDGAINNPSERLNKAGVFSASECSIVIY